MFSALGCCAGVGGSQGWLPVFWDPWLVQPCIKGVSWPEHTGTVPQAQSHLQALQ